MAASHTGIDTTANLTSHLPMLASNGVRYASRYLRSGGLSKAEADDVRAHKINLILNYEGKGNDIHAFSTQTGIRDATYALGVAKALGAPVGTAIYFSCEPENLTSLTADYSNRVLPYWRALRSVLGGQYRIGAYTFGTWLGWLIRDNATDFCWLPNATGWAGYHDFLASNKWHYHQIPGGSNVNFNGLLVDWDEPNPNIPDIGAWMADAPSVVPPEIADPPVIDGAIIGRAPLLRKGNKSADVKSLQLILGIDPADGDFGPHTEQAIKQYQQDHALAADGIVGPNTWASIAMMEQGV